MSKKKTIATLVIMFQLLSLVESASHNTYGLTGNFPAYFFDMDIETSTIRGFEKVVQHPQHPNTPDFVLERGRTGTVNLTFTSTEENRTVRVFSIEYGGIPPYNYGWSGSPRYLPDGITASFEPQNLTLPPRSKATVTMRISAAPDTEIRRYNLTLLYRLGETEIVQGAGAGHSTILSIVGETLQSTTNTTNTTTKITCINQTVTTTRTITVTSSNSTTRTITTAATPNLSATTSTPTTVSTTFTSTTTTTSTKQIADSSIYAWAIGATAVAVILAVVALRRRG